jgi:hypothetical protein
MIYKASQGMQLSMLAWATCGCRRGGARPIDETRAPRDHRSGDGRRHQLLRHGIPLPQRGVRNLHRPRPGGLPPAGSGTVASKMPGI